MVGGKVTQERTGMVYVLTRSTIDCSTVVELSEAEYLEIETAKHRVIILTGIEEKYELLFSNYAEYERTLLDLSLDKLLHVHRGYSDFHDDRGLVNRRLVNLLSSTRAYVDQVTHDVGELAGADAQEFIKALFSREYDAHLSYRVMETLRNYVQHRSLPVGAMEYPSGWDKGPPTPLSRRRHRVLASLDTEALGDSGSPFKLGVLQELQAFKKRFLPLTTMVRQYIDCFGRVHGDLRKRVESTANEAERVIRVAHERAIEACGSGSGVGVVIRRESDEGDRIEQHDIFLEMLDRRRDIVSRNATHLNLSQGHVSSEDDPE